MDERNHDPNAGRNRSIPWRIAKYTQIAVNAEEADEEASENTRQPIPESVMRVLTKGGNFQSRHFLKDLMLRQGIDFTAEPCREKKAEVNVP